ncbi:MAG: hypothetical protein ACJLS2_10715 [Microcella pacifica]|nr:DUF3137 domain-containing protein [Actinomycetota bacterium]MBU1608361.1 DUF3137 domain-containing protein [Actinomycetota bacterium]MBU2316517.1 DUF3137 domain-containing protein [Actinomycetota bacterium]MBU2385246.1 DUF3137 domain-containing protein [Actinomycetota bacterium]
MDRTIDYLPLFSPIERQEVHDYRRRVRAERDQSAAVIQTVMRVLVIGLVVIVTASITGPLLALSIGSVLSGDLVGIAGLAVPLIILGAVAAVAWSLLRGAAPQWEQRLRMHRFAEANGLVYEMTSPAPSYPGAIFGQGRSRRVSDHFRTADGRFLDFGNYRYVTGSGKNSTTHHWGFLALHLDRALPHMLLDSRANNGMFGASNLPTSFRRDQVLSLEGDFDRSFTLYCPREYERDALYVFTPDLMALLIDEAAPYDVEIVDRWLFVYAARPFPLADPHTYQRLLRIVDTVGRKTLSQTDRYRDERVGDVDANIVARQGRRLRAGVPLATVIIGVIVAALWGFSFFGGLLGG